MNRLGRPKSSKRIRKQDCAAVPIRELEPLIRGTDAVIPLSGTIGGVLPFQLEIRVMRTAAGWRCLCPRCNRRAAMIYFPPNSTEPGCRVCLRLVYDSQYEKLPVWAQAMRYEFEQMREKSHFGCLCVSRRSAQDDPNQTTQRVLTKPNGYCTIELPS